MKKIRIYLTFGGIMFVMSFFVFNFSLASTIYTAGGGESCLAICQSHGGSCLGWGMNSTADDKSACAQNYSQYDCSFIYDNIYPGLMGCALNLPNDHTPCLGGTPECINASKNSWTTKCKCSDPIPVNPCSANSATGTLACVSTSVINTGVSMGTNIFSKYWGYIFIIGLITTLLLAIGKVLLIKKEKEKQVKYQDYMTPYTKRKSKHHKKWHN